MDIKITELDELLNTLQTSSLEPHEEYKMEFTNREQTVIYEYIKDLQQKNKELEDINDKISSALDSAETKIDKVVKYLEHEIKYSAGTDNKKNLMRFVICNDILERIKSGKI